MRRPSSTVIYGVLAEFKSAQELLDAVKKTIEEGYRDVEAYTPFPVEEISEALGHRTSRLPLIVLIGGVVGGASGYFFQLWANGIDYPLNVGGRPLHSWPMFIPITFEMTILVAVLSAVLGMFILNGLPMPYHPLFNSSRFALASRDRYFLVIKATDPKLDRDATWDFLLSLNPYEVDEVEP